MVLARNLLGTLRQRDLDSAARGIAGETGLPYRPGADGQRVSGIYRRHVVLASGRYAVLEDGIGFSLAPWRPVIEHRLGQRLSVVVRSGNATWGDRTAARHGLKASTAVQPQPRWASATHAPRATTASQLIAGRSAITAVTKRGSRWSELHSGHPRAG